MTDAHALEVQTLFRGVLIGTKQVTRTHTHTRSRRGRARPLFVIGSTARADAPVAAACLGGGSELDSEHALVTAGDGGDGRYAVCVTPSMTGVITNDEGMVVTPARAGGQDATFTLRPGDRARVDCGAVTFLLASTRRAPLVAAPRIDWRSYEHRYHLATALGVVAFLLMLRALPADPRSLSLDLFARERSHEPYLVKAPMPAPIPLEPSSAKRSADAAAQPGRRTPERPGEMGRETARDRDRRYAVQGRRDNLEVRLARPAPADDAADAGVLGVIRRSAAVSSIFARDSAFGRDADDVLGSLVGDTIGIAFGHGALGPMGTGSGGGGTGEHALGVGPDLTMLGAGVGRGWRPGVAVGTLGTRHAGPPGVWVGEPRLAGSLDREIVRRIIRRHINEVKFCYEQALVTQPKLGGRILVRFMIAANGQVLSSVVESSTLANARVESCTAQAVRRWEFPRPVGGGLVNVSYPFVLTPAGGAG
jgi:hypothetical protein